MTFRVTLIKNRSQNVSGYLGTPLVFGKSGTSSVLDSPSTDKSKKLTKLLEPLKGSDFLSSELKKLCYELKKIMLKFRASNLLLEKEGTLHILGELPTLFQCIRYPSVGLGVLRWVEATTTPKYLEKQLEGTPFSLALVDEVLRNAVLIF